MGTDNLSFQQPFDPNATDGATQVGKSWNEALSKDNEQKRADESHKQQMGQSTLQSATDVATSDLTGVVTPPPTPLLPQPDIKAVGASTGLGSIDQTDTGGKAFSALAYQQVMGAVLDMMVDSAKKAADASDEANLKAQKDQVRKHAELLAHEVQQDIRKQEIGLPPGFFDPTTIAPLLLVMGGFAAVMASGKIDLSDASQLGINALQNHVSIPLNMVPSDMRAELGYLGAWMAGAAAFQAGALTVGNAGNANEQQLTRAFARNYGDKILTMVQDKEFDGYLDAIVYSKAPGAGLVTREQAEQYKAALKLGLLTSAFALIYKANHDGMSGREVMSQIMNQNLEDAGSAAPLLLEIRKQLGVLPEDQKRELNRQLVAFLDSKPPTEALMDPIKIFQGMYKGSQINDQQATHTSI